MKERITIVPYPFEVKEYDEVYKRCGDTVLVCTDKSQTQVENSVIEKLFENAGLKVLFCDECKADAGNGMLVNLVKTDVYDEKPLGSEGGYGLEIKNQFISIYASTKNGFLYGLTSLCQIFMNDEIPCCSIYDKPAYEWRGFLLDTCRTFYSVEFIKKMLDACLFHKMNVFHWHLTDDQGWRFNIPEYPLLLEIGSKRKAHTVPESEDKFYEEGGAVRQYYTDEEIADVLSYAEHRGIMVVPEVEFPGHASALLAAYPEFGCTGGPYNVENRFGIFPDVMCLGNDKLFDLFEKIISTVTRLFPSKYFHIGGDECMHERWEVCPKCKKRMAENKLLNASQLQSWGTQKIVKMILAHDRIPIGWDEVLDNTEIIPLPEDIIVQSWRGIEGGEIAVKQNHKVIMSPQTHCYMDHKNLKSFEEPGRLGVITLETAYSYSPVTENMSEEAYKYVLGGEGTLWAEAPYASKIAEYMIFPRFCAIAESLWLPLEKKSFERFTGNLDNHKQRLHKLGYLYYDGAVK